MNRSEFAKHLLMIMVLFFAMICKAMANTQWPMWDTFKQYYISQDGRVIDSSSPEKKTTSEGQSYALFFALVANDQKMFDTLIHWTENNLAKGNIGNHLPAWAWGKNSKNEWTILDSNSAADADLWIAYDLIEAGRLWHNAYYTSQGKKLLQLILQEEVKPIPGFGLMVLPGKVGFDSSTSWRLNPSYLPPQLFARFAKINKDWQPIETNSRRLLLETSPKGFAPDWVIWKKGTGWAPDTNYPNIGSYDAIRVYLWVGMLAKRSPQQTELMIHFSPMITLIQTLGAPPEKINIINLKTQGQGPIGFSAALLPLLSNNPKVLSGQRKRVDSQPLMPDEYYNSVLRLFGQGWDQNRFRFNAQGELQL